MTPFAAVVLPRSSEQPLLLAGTSQEIWALLDEPRTAAELAGALCERYEADPLQIAADLSDWLATLYELRAVRTSS
jgi:hypothetical protein